MSRARDGRSIRCSMSRRRIKRREGRTVRMVRRSIRAYTHVHAVWTEWAPAGPIFYNSTNFHIGDVIHARVVAHSENLGTTYLENPSTGEKLETSYSNQTHTLKLGDVDWVVESQLQLTELGPEGSLGARYTPWIFENAEYLTKGK